MNNHLHSHINRSAPATQQSSNNTATSQPVRSSTPIIQSNSNAGNLNETQLNTLVPIFGSDDVQLQIRDLVNVFPPPSTLNRIRIDLRNFVLAKLQLSSAPNEDDIATVNFNLKFFGKKKTFVFNYFFFYYDFD